MKALQFDWFGKRFGGGLDIYPYQLTLGVSLRYWPCIFAPSIRIYVGPFKLWGYIKLRREHEDDRKGS